MDFKILGRREYQHEFPDLERRRVALDDRRHRSGVQDEILPLVVGQFRRRVLDQRAGTRHRKCSDEILFAWPYFGAPVLRPAGRRHSGERGEKS